MHAYIHAYGIDLENNIDIIIVIICLEYKVCMIVQHGSAHLHRSLNYHRKCT